MSMKEYLATLQAKEGVPQALLYNDANPVPEHPSKATTNMPAPQSALVALFKNHKPNHTQQAQLMPSWALIDDMVFH